MSTLSPTRLARPTTIDEATALLAEGGWSLLAGGTDVFASRVGRPDDTSWIDLTRVDALRGIREDAAGWWFGATTTWTDVLQARLPAVFNALRQAAHEVGGEQVQNAGTIGGNLCNASPAADGTPVWLALDAQAVLRSREGERRLPVAEFVLGSRRTAIAPGELLAGVHVPARSTRARSVFLKLGARRYLVISVTMIAVAIDADGAGRVSHAGIAVGSCAARATRLDALEAKVRGRSLGSLAGVAVAEADLAALTPIDDVRGSAAYRLDATATLLRRALESLQR